MAEKTEKRCFMEISINGKPRGKIDFKLYNDVVPETCYNFLQLCIGSEKLGEMTGKKLTYQGSTFHRVVKGFMIQGGDFSKHDGTGGECIYNRHNGIFDDENFSIKFDKPYILAMANRGPNTNGSQFFITTSECPSLNGKHVAFGEVVGGHEIVNAIENCEVNSNSRPMADIIITNCGELKRNKRTHSEGQEKSVEKKKKKETKAEENKIFSTIKPEDLPELPPTRNFLDRGPPEKDEQRPERSSRYSSSQRRYSSNGREVEVKGRGVPRYCPYSKSSNLIHWEKEGRRIIPQKKAIEIIARATKEAERGIKESDKPRERSSSVSSIDSVKRENSSKPDPSSNIPNYESQDEKHMEIDGSNTVAEHISYKRRFDDGNTSLENRRNDNSPKDRRAHRRHKHRDRRSVDRDDDGRRYNSTSPEKPHKHHDPTKFLAFSSSHTPRHETLKRYGREKSKSESPKRSRYRPKSHRVRGSSRRHRHDHRSPLRSSRSVSPRSPRRD